MENERVPLIPDSKSNLRAMHKLVLFTFLSSFAISMSGPASMDLQYYSICRSLDISQDQCFTSPDAALAEADVSGYGSTISSILRLVMVPVTLVAAHKFGRKYTLIFSLFLSVLRHFLTWYLAFFSTNSYYWLLVPTVLGAVYSSGGELLTIPYICDFAVDAEDRAKYIGWTLSASFASVIFGPVSGSTLITAVGLYNFYLIAIAIELATVLIGFYLLESKEPLDNPDEPAQTPLESLKTLDCLALKHLQDPQERKTGLQVVGLITFTTSFAASISNLLYLHVKYTWGWSAREWGLLASALSIISLACYTFIGPYLTIKLHGLYGSNEYHYDRVDRVFLQFSLWIELIPYGLIAMTKNQALFAFSAGIEAFSAISNAPLIAMLCKYGPRTSEGPGQIFASFKLATNILGLVLPLIVFKIYGLTVTNWSTFIFSLSGSIFVLSSLYLTRVKVAASEPRPLSPSI